MGWSNSLAMELGGGTSHVEDVYAALKSAVGIGGSARDDNGLEARWRAAKAGTIAGALDAYERAVLQALPAHATDHIPVYERILGIAPGSDQNEEDRRIAVTAAWVLQILSTMPELDRSVQAISSQLRVVELDYQHVVYTLFGKMFEAYGSEALGKHAYPNYSTDFILRVDYTLTSGETTIPQQIRIMVARLLNAALPTWIDWRLQQVRSPAIGLICDGASAGSVLNYTPLAH